MGRGGGGRCSSRLPTPKAQFGRWVAGPAGLSGGVASSQRFKCSPSCHSPCLASSCARRLTFFLDLPVVPKAAAGAEPELGTYHDQRSRPTCRL